MILHIIHIPYTIYYVLYIIHDTLHIVNYTQMLHCYLIFSMLYFVSIFYISCISSLILTPNVYVARGSWFYRFGKNSYACSHYYKECPPWSLCVTSTSPTCCAVTEERALLLQTSTKLASIGNHTISLECLAILKTPSYFVLVV